MVLAVLILAAVAVVLLAVLLAGLVLVLAAVRRSLSGLRGGSPAAMFSGFLPPPE